MSIAKTAVCSGSAFKNLDKKIKNTKGRKARKELIKQQKKILINGTGKGLYFVAKILGYIVLVLPYIKHIIAWATDKLLFVEFLVSMIVALFCELLCSATSAILKFVPGAGIMLGMVSGWIIGMLLDRHFNDKRIDRIAAYFNKKLSTLKTLRAWINAFGYALTI